ncbi:hypothetical protein [Candidatus Mycoplasma haematohominis]|uniref:Uncharacterized protein n=1 Tax=Candidatus Mycoplasma haematohominis TaxID=1494318 RepID=A0A478FRI0_9MOLU|nr:hypothetical protein [Candidatus Mycoplasma haemohominis]GCE63787.1 hypothetical protein MHSWG343_07940 [Candidatus Mycoplasma haemohominis]
MVPFFKVGFAVVVLAATSVGGYYLFNMETGEKKSAILLSERPSPDSVYTSDKFGGIYSIYMVDPNKAENEWWWNRVYENLKKDIADSTKNTKLSDKFQKGKIDKAYSSVEDGKALNHVCDAAFKSTPDSLKTPANYEENAWTYCSIVNAKYIFVTDKYTGKFGSKPEHKNKILSVENNDNDAFWTERNKQFFGEAEKAGWGAKASEGSEFAKLYKKKSENSRGNDDTIKKKCKDAYDTPTSGTPTVKDTDIEKFCYLIPKDI